MRILLDESIPRRFGSLLLGHSVTTVAKQGWAGVKNGQLLALTATQFDVLITADRNIEYQQNLNALPISIIILVTYSNRIESLTPLVPNILEALNCLSPRSIQRIGDY